VLNTPTITSTKWWPGELGHFSNHALVFAKLIIKDEEENPNSYGVVPFIVQIRDLATHKHMAGVKTGNVGPKFGYNDKDNGWMTLNNVRVPRDNLLQRFIKVDSDGSVSVQGDLRMLYSTMLKVRNLIVISSKWIYHCALTVVLRYSIMRRQFKNITGMKEETQLIDYQTQQMKLFPLISEMFAHSQFGNHLHLTFLQFLKDTEKQDFKLLDLLHHLSSGGKSVHTQEALDGIIKMR
jgi:acyl-CoA oxidase